MSKNKSITKIKLR